MAAKMAKKTSSETDEILAKSVDSRIKKIVERALARNILGLTLQEANLDIEVGPTPKELVYTRDSLRLYHYRPMVDEIYRIPLMIVMSPVARGYILDLAKGQSLIEYLLLQGYDVYLMDWVPPRREHSHLGMRDFALDLIDESIASVQGNSGETDVTVIGYCMGGLLAAMNAAVHHDGPIKNLVCFATPVNSNGMALYKKWADSESFDIDLIVDELGIIPGDMIGASIQALRPLQKQANQMQLLNNAQNDTFVKASMRFDRWAAEQLPIPGELARGMFRDFLRDNKLVKNEYMLGDQRVVLGNIQIPFLHVAAEYDHIVPTAASSDLVKMVGSEDKQEIVVRGGHVSLVAGGNAVYRLWPQLDQWLGLRSV
ncbi:MAG: alpha/beta fold hydrolase [Gammaproteobacteria bacterium]|nr:alpha/beta fold hydrolase [Gammaproteobacteria bacterium]